MRAWALMAAGAMALTGELAPGVTCPVLLTDDGRRIALEGLPAGFAPGERITVTGPGFGASMTCQREVFLVGAARRAGPRGDGQARPAAP